MEIVDHKHCVNFLQETERTNARSSNEGDRVTGAEEGGKRTLVARSVGR